VKHVIEMWESDGRVQWECDCGHGGSEPAGNGDLAAEKHIREGDRVSYRYRGADQ
jgi:hypothetical protein